MTIAETTSRSVLPDLCLIGDEIVRLPTQTKPLDRVEVPTCGESDPQPQRREFWVGD